MTNPQSPTPAASGLESAPTVHGWYWHWDGEVSHMLHVWERPGHSYLAVQEEHANGKRHFRMVNKMGGKWFGPINPPAWEALAAQPAPGVGGKLPSMEAPMPTIADAEASIDGALADALKAVNVLSTMLQKVNLPGFAVADEIAGSIVHAQKMRTALSTRPAESVDEEMTRLMEIHGVSDLPALVRMLLRFNENLRSRQRPDPEIPQRAPREG